MNLDWGGVCWRIPRLTYIVSFEAPDRLHPGLLDVALHFLYEDPKSSVDRLQEFVHVGEICKAKSDIMYAWFSIMLWYKSLYMYMLERSLKQDSVRIQELENVRSVRAKFNSERMLARWSHNNQFYWLKTFTSSNYWAPLCCEQLYMSFMTSFSL